jgi:hypothetical protein
MNAQISTPSFTAWIPLPAGPGLVADGGQEAGDLEYDQLQGAAWASSRPLLSWT